MDSIQLSIYISFTFLVIIFLIFVAYLLGVTKKKEKKSAVLHSKKNTKKTGIIKENVRKDLNYNFDKLEILKGYFLYNNSNYIYNGNLKEGTILSSKVDFYLKLLGTISKMRDEGVYKISDASFQSLSLVIQKGNIKEIISALDYINKQDKIEEEKEGFSRNGEVLLKTFMIQALSHGTYNYFGENAKKYLEDFNEKKNSILKKQENNIKLEDEDKEVIKVLQVSKEIIQELNNIVKDKNIYSFIKFDKDTKTVHLKLDYKKVFSKDIKNIISFFKQNYGEITDFVKFYFE